MNNLDLKHLMVQSTKHMKSEYSFDTLAFDYTYSTINSVDNYNHLFNVITDYDENSDTVMSLFRGGAGHVSSGSSLYMMKSSDKGQNFTMPTKLNGVIFDTNIDYRNIGGGYTKTGRFILIYDKYNPSTGKHSHIFYRYTDNNGDTWSTEKSAKSDLACDFTISGMDKGIIELEDGVIGIAYYQRENSTNKRKFGMTISHDMGESFDEYRDSGFILPETHIIGEPSMLKISDGVILCVLRDAESSYGHAANMVEYISYDYGFTWEYQGTLDFDTVYPQTNSDDHMLPKLSTINIFGEKVIALYYTKRKTNELKVIYAKPYDILTKKGEFLGWNSSTLKMIHKWKDGQSIDGNGCVLHVKDNFRGIFMAEDQSYSQNSTLAIIPTPNNMMEIAKKLNIGIVISPVYVTNTQITHFTPYYVGQMWCNDEGKIKLATDTKNKTDWT